jgi:branched-chain amino acid transport system ATP-binding protein
MSVLRTQGLSKSFGSLAVTQSITATFEPGVRTAIIGPNGAGKTTFFNLLAGTLRPDGGTIHLGDRDITGLDMAARARIGIARSYQRNNLFADMTVRENLALGCALKAGEARIFWRPMARLVASHARADGLAEQVGLADCRNTVVRQLSYGSQRQLEVGLALATAPSVLLLDEPTSGMSPEETGNMHRLITALPRALTVVVIEHDMDIVLDFADHIIVLDYGRLLAQGSPSAIRASAVVRERYLGEAAS